MKNLLLILPFLCITPQVDAQPDSVHLQKTVSPDSKEMLQWVGTLYEHGVRVEQDSLVLSSEVQELMANDVARASLYPEVYTWEQALELMQQMELKSAFWFLINLYPENKELVMRTVLGYDELFEMEHALVAAFYTYSMLDPQVAAIEHGKPSVKRPDILERKLANVTEMVSYVLTYRTQRSQE